MGVWGYRPYDSDDAQDWLGDIETLIVKQIKTAMRNGTPNEVIAAAGMLTELDKPPIDLCYEATQEGLYYKMVAQLDKLKCDEPWVKTWSNPELIGLQIGILILKLQAVALSYAELQTCLRKTVKFKTTTAKRKLRKGKKGARGKKP